MYKPIIEQEKISLAIYYFLLKLILEIIINFFFCLFIVQFIFFLNLQNIPPKFPSILTTLNLLALIFKFSVWSSSWINFLSLKFSIEHFINSDRFLNGIVEQEYIIKGSITLVEYWGKDYKKIFTLNPISF